MFTLTKYRQRILLLAFGHGLNDFAAGYMLGHLLYLETDLVHLSFGFLIYNLLAFGGQYFVALLINKFPRLRFLLTVAVILNIIAIALFFVQPYLSLILAGSGSAIYHVAGGTACSAENKATPIGLFAAPGILGLVCAGYLAFLRTDVWIFLLMTCVGFCLLLQLISFPYPRMKADSVRQEKKFQIDNHDVFMILLLAIISLRSAVWNIFQLIYDQNYSWLLAIAISAFIGKIAGGWISDRVGWRLYSLVSLTIAMPMVSFFKDELILFCIGIGILQSAIPANTAMMIEYCKGQREKGVAVSFGAAIIAGAVLAAPVRLFSVNNTIYWALIILFACSLLLMRKNKFTSVKKIFSRL